MQNLFQKNKRGFYEFTRLKELGLLNAVSTKAYGNLSFRYGAKEEVEANRRRFAGDVGFDLASIAQPDLVHAAAVAVVDRPGVTANTDGLITNQKKLPLFLLTGDCAPIILFDPKKAVLGLVHSGWKGTVGKIALVAAAKMAAVFSCRFDDLVVAIGPSIEKCCYRNLRPNLQEVLPEWEPFVHHINDRESRIDLNGFTVNQLKAVGVKEANIFWSQVCTNDHSEEFYCYQRETAGKDKPGRFATVVQLDG
jgi:YfiH family protein